MTERITLYADEGMILTDGEIFGRIITLAVDRKPSEFYEITEKEYQAIIDAEEAKTINEDYDMIQNKGEEI